jgi:hypothetical protein
MFQFFIMIPKTEDDLFNSFSNFGGNLKDEDYRVAWTQSCPSASGMERAQLP